MAIGILILLSFCLLGLVGLFGALIGIKVTFEARTTTLTECCKETVSCIKEGMQMLNSSMTEMRMAVKSMEREQDEIRNNVDVLKAAMITALQGINKNTRSTLQALVEAVAKNDAVKLSQVVRAARTLIDNYDEVQNAFDDASSDFSFSRLTSNQTGTSSGYSSDSSSGYSSGILSNHNLMTSIHVAVGDDD